MTKQTCIGQQRNDFMLIPVLWGYDIKHTSCKTQIKKQGYVYECVMLVRSAIFS